MRRFILFIATLSILGAGWQLASPKSACAQGQTFSCCGSTTGYIYQNGVCITDDFSTYIRKACQTNFVDVIGNAIRLIPGVTITNEDITNECIKTISGFMPDLANGYTKVVDASSQVCIQFITNVFTKIGYPAPQPNSGLLGACISVVDTIFSGYSNQSVMLANKCPDPLTCNYGTGMCTGSLGTKICSFISTNESDPTRKSCETCFDKPGVFTPFGCIEATPQLFVTKILQIAIGISGGIAFLMIVYGGFVTMTSAGNPEQLTNGKEIITSAIAGLLMIIFSVVILKIIGVDILGLPGFE